MSTPAVRSALLAEIESLSPVPVYNVSDYVSQSTLDDQCLLVDFVASSEQITTIGDPDSLGFEETGTVSLHWLCPTGFASAPILATAETLRLAMRGRKINRIHIESIEPFSDAGSPIDLDGRWTAFTSIFFYSLHSCG
jgi:hypothetical protein